MQLKTELMELVSAYENFCLSVLCDGAVLETAFRPRVKAYRSLNTEHTARRIVAQNDFVIN